MLNRNIGFGYTTIIIVISTTDGLGGRHRRSSSWTEAVREMTARNYSNTKTSRTFFTIFIHSVHNLILLIINEIKQQKNLKSLFLVSRSKTAESLWRAGISITTLIPHQHQCSARSEARVKSRTCWVHTAHPLTDCQCAPWSDVTRARLHRSRELQSTWTTEHICSKRNGCCVELDISILESVRNSS